MKNRTQLLLLSLCIGGYGNSVFAAGESCVNLLQSCQAQKKISENGYQSNNPTELVGGSYCLGYFEGFANAITGLGSQVFCLPNNSSTAQLSLVYLKWADRHPERLHEAAGVCAAAALNEVFPCSQKN